MANYVLKPVFSTIFGHDFDRYSFDDRLEMQKSIYLLLFIIIALGANRLYSQVSDPQLEYVYDATGNRTMRHVIYIIYNKDIYLLLLVTTHEQGDMLPLLFIYKNFSPAGHVFVLFTLLGFQL